MAVSSTWHAEHSGRPAFDRQILRIVANRLKVWIACPDSPAYHGWELRKVLLMLTRIVSLLLMAVVVACPVWCGDGACRDDHCCAADGCSSQQQPSCACSAHKTGDCLGEKPAEDRDEKVPYRCPKEGSCQGICGGVVFEKLCEFEEPFSFFLMPPIDSDGSQVSLLARYRTEGLGRHLSISAKNYGRFVRTLHCSFLC